MHKVTVYTTVTVSGSCDFFPRKEWFPERLLSDLMALMLIWALRWLRAVATSSHWWFLILLRDQREVFVEIKPPHGWLLGTSTSYQLCCLPVNDSCATLLQTASVPWGALTCSMPSHSAPACGFLRHRVNRPIACFFVNDGRATCVSPALSSPYSFELVNAGSLVHKVLCFKVTLKIWWSINKIFP